MSDWILTAVLGAVGLFFLIMTYAAVMARPENGRSISGVPVLGGLLIAAAFLLSPIKWLAVLGLLDYGIWMIPVEAAIEKKFTEFYRQKDLVPISDDLGKKVIITIPELDEEFTRDYIPNLYRPVRIHGLRFSVCSDRSGRWYILYRIKRNRVEMTSFDDMVSIDSIDHFGKKISVEIKLV